MAHRITQFVMVAAIAGALVAAMHARTPQTSPSDASVPAQTFRSGTDLVVLHVNVFDGRSDAVAELPQTAFEVFEDDVKQEIAFFNSADVPVAVGLVIDNSGSMITRRRMVLAGGEAFVKASHPEDELFTVHFNENVRLGLPDVLPFTSQASMLQAAMARYTAGGKTALFDAVIRALEHVERASHQKHVLVVLSDGADNASRASERDMLARARSSDAIIYTVSNADRRNGDAGDADVLRRLADTTGGTAYFPRSTDAVVAAFERIAGNVRRGYSIGYIPANGTRDGGFRSVRVVARAPGHGRLTVRSRNGYTAPDHIGAR